MRIAYTNLVDSATAPSALTADLLYPITNVQNQRVAKRWRSTSPTAQTVTVDLDAATDVDTIAIIGHSFTSAATLTISANASDAWTAPSFTTTLSYNENMILKFLSSAETYQYWQFSLDDPTNTLGYVDAGRLWFSERLEVDPSSTLDFGVEKLRSDTVAYGRDRQKYATQGVGWRRFTMSFPRTGGTALTNVLTMFDAVGNHDSVIFANFNTDRSYEIVEPCYCSINNSMSFQHTTRMKFQWNLVLEEDR